MLYPWRKQRDLLGGFPKQGAGIRLETFKKEDFFYAKT